MGSLSEDEISPDLLKLLAALDDVEKPHFKEVMKEAARKLETEELKKQEKQWFLAKLAAGEEGAKDGGGPPIAPAQPLPPDEDLPGRPNKPHEVSAGAASCRAPAVKVPTCVRDLFPQTGPFTVRFRKDHRKIAVDFRFLDCRQAGYTK